MTLTPSAVPDPATVSVRRTEYGPGIVSESPARWTCTVSGFPVPSETVCFASGATALEPAQSVDIVMDEDGSTDPRYWVARVRTEWQDGTVVERFFYGDDQTGVLTEDSNEYRESPAHR